MNNKSKNDKYKDFGESLDILINARIREYVKDFIKQEEVVVKKVYNEFNYSLRRVDVALTSDIKQSIPIKQLPVNVPYHVKEGDMAFLFYFDKPINGWIGNMITYNDITAGE